MLTSLLSFGTVKDATNPSKLGTSDYRNGAKRAAEAARRVRPRLKKEMVGRDLAVGNDVYIRVFKRSYELELWMLNKVTKKFVLFKTYKIKGMSGVIGPKIREGDMQAPEGFYRVWRGAMNPQSRFHLSFNLGYPNRYDKAYGRTGSALMLHGNSVSAGCMAMSDYYMEEIYTLCAAAQKSGQKSFQVHSYPFKMTKVNLEGMRGNKWFGFWKNLQVGYDAFERKRVPPRFKVVGKRYVLL